MARKRQAATAVLERGDIFFFYRPDRGDDSPGGLLDVRRFHIVLRPHGSNPKPRSKASAKGKGRGGERLRLITIGRKMLPEGGPEGHNQNHWGFVARVCRTAEEFREEVLGTSVGEGDEGQGSGREPAARPAGEGVYALARSGRGTVLAYVLELPEQPGPVQEAFHIGPEGRFLISIKNPEAASPAGVGLDGERRVEFPEELQARFGARKWLPADPPEFLDHEGAELILIAGRGEDSGEGLELDADLGLEPEREDEQGAEVFRDLRLEKSERTVKPLLEGAWA